MAAGKSLGPSQAAEGGHFLPSLLYAAAKLYYLEDATQAQIADRLGTSRATVSRLLAQARAQGIVRIEVVAPDNSENLELADQVARALGLQRVFLSEPLPRVQPGRAVEDVMGPFLAAALARALRLVDLLPGEVLLVSSGRTVYEVARYELGRKPGVLVTPTIGGNDQPEGWYQSNEIARLIAKRLGGRAMYLFAPALPGPDLYKTLHADPAIQRVLQLWPRAKCILMGVGSPPLLRSQMPQLVPLDSDLLLQAVGDVCSRYYDRVGEPVEYPGSERLISIKLENLKKIPTAIAIAAGHRKVTSVITGALAGYFNHLVTDPLTAQQLLASI